MSSKLQNAYDTVSDPAKRRSYDAIWTGIRDRLRAQQELAKRQADAAEAEKKKATEQKLKKQKEDDARPERLRSLNLTKFRYDSEIFELSRVVRRLTADLKRLQDQDDEDSRKEREQNSRRAYMTSPIYGKVEESKEQKQARETARLHRLASKSIKGSELRAKEAKLKKLQSELQSALQDVDSQISVERQKAEDAAGAQTRERKARMDREAKDQAQEETREWLARFQRESAERAAKEAREAQAARKAQEARDRTQNEMRERLARVQKDSAERAAKEAREAQAAQEARKAQERVQEAAVAERRKREAEEEAQATRAVEEALRKAREARNTRTKPAPPFQASLAPPVPLVSTDASGRRWREGISAAIARSCRNASCSSVPAAGR